VKTPFLNPCFTLFCTHCRTADCRTVSATLWSRQFLCLLLRVDLIPELCHFTNKFRFDSSRFHNLAGFSWVAPSACGFPSFSRWSCLSRRPEVCRRDHVHAAGRSPFSATPARVSNHCHFRSNVQQLHIFSAVPTALLSNRYEKNFCTCFSKRYLKVIF